MAQVMTVLGPVAPEELGVTLPHEHLLLDLSCLWHQPRDPARAALVDAPLELATRGLLLCDPYHCRANMHLDDLDLAVEEVGRFADLGGRTVVDLSTRTIGPYPQQLAALARRSGLHVVAGTGFYVRAAHPGWVAGATVEDLAAHMIAELSESFAATGPADRRSGDPRSGDRHSGDGHAGDPRPDDGHIGEEPVRAGMIGEIGTGSPIHPHEEKALRAAARAHHATGAAINVHLSTFAREGHGVLDILEAEGVDPRRVALSHLDEQELPADDYQRSLAARGAYVEFDCFGSECYYDERGVREPSDGERLDALLRLLDAGLGSQLLLSQDVCTRMQLRRYGGMGYDHILRTIVPRLRRRGADDATLRLLLVENPARLLTPSR